MSAPADRLDELEARSAARGPRRSVPWLLSCVKPVAAAVLLVAAAVSPWIVLDG